MSVLLFPFEIIDVFLLTFEIQVMCVIFVSTGDQDIFLFQIALTLLKSHIS